LEKFEMPALSSLTPRQRPTPLPAELREMIRICVRGNPETGEMVEFFEAARLAGVQALRARRWNERNEFHQALSAERKLFRREIAAGDELALVQLRNRSKNPMAVLGAIKAIEELNAETAAHAPASAAAADRFVIQIVSHSDRPSAVTIDAHPLMPVAPHPYPSREPVAVMPAPELSPDEPVFEPDPEPIFRMRKPWE
jgi:hypothetical protein